MVWNVDEDHPLRKLFRGLVEQVFYSDLGLCDPRVTDYVAGLLAGFVHVDRIYALRNVDGERIRELSRMEADAWLGREIDVETRSRTVNRFIGDFTLFWTGVYPESLRPRNAGTDRLAEFLLQGKNSYAVAGELSDRDSDPPNDLLLRLSHDFEACVHGLQLVRGGWENEGRGGSDRLIPIISN